MPIPGISEPSLVRVPRRLPYPWRPTPFPGIALPSQFACAMQFSPISPDFAKLCRAKTGFAELQLKVVWV